MEIFIDGALLLLMLLLLLKDRAMGERISQSLEAAGEAQRAADRGGRELAALKGRFEDVLGEAERQAEREKRWNEGISNILAYSGKGKEGERET